MLGTYGRSDVRPTETKLMGFLGDNLRETQLSLRG